MHKHKHKHLARPSFCIFKEGTRKEVGISFNGFCFYTAMPSFGRMCTKVKEWNICKLKGLHLIHLNINSLLPKMDKLQYTANSSNAAVIGIPKYRFDKFFLPSEV